MADIPILLPKTQDLLDVSRNAFVSAARMFDLNINPSAAPLELKAGTLGDSYSGETLQQHANWTVLAQNQFAEFLDEIKYKTQFTAAEVDRLVETMGWFVLQVQYLSTLAAVKHICDGYYKGLRKGNRGKQHRKISEKSTSIIVGLMRERPEGITRLTELRSVAGISKEDIDYFLEIEPGKQFDRKPILRTLLERVGLYKGKVGRPSESRVKNSKKRKSKRAR